MVLVDCRPIPKLAPVVEKGFFSDIWEIFCEGKLAHVEASSFDGNISKFLNNRTAFDNKYAVNTILVIGKLFYEKIKTINVEKFENDVDNVKDKNPLENSKLLNNYLNENYSIDQINDLQIPKYFYDLDDFL